MYYKDIEYYYEINKDNRIKFEYVGKRFLPLRFRFKFNRPTFKDGKEVVHKWRYRLIKYHCFKCTRLKGIYLYESDRVSYYINHPNGFYIVMDYKLALKVNLKLKNKIDLL